MKVQRKGRTVPALLLAFMLISSIFLQDVSIIKAEEPSPGCFSPSGVIQEEPEAGPDTEGGESAELSSGGSEEEAALMSSERQPSESEETLEDAEQLLFESGETLEGAEQQPPESEERLESAERQSSESEERLESAERQSAESEETLEGAEQLLFESGEALESSERQTSESGERLEGAERQPSESEEGPESAERFAFKPGTAWREAKTVPNDAGEQKGILKSTDLAPGGPQGAERILEDTEPVKGSTEEPETVLKKAQSVPDIFGTAGTRVAGVSYPVYVYQSSVRLLDKISGKVVNAGIGSQKAKDVSVGEAVTSRHRPIFMVACPHCMETLVVLAPIVYGAVSVSASEASILSDPEYASGVWTDGGTMIGSGCLELSCETLRPGKTKLYVDFAARFDNYWGAGGQCPRCKKEVSPVYTSDKWYQYRNYYTVNVYADYTLVYDANAHTDPVTSLPPPETKREYGDSTSITVTDQQPVREGYEFLGWSEKETDAMSRYDAGDPVTLDWEAGAETEKKLYAVWRKLTHGVSPEDPGRGIPDLTIIKRACQTDTLTPVASVETGEEYCYVVTVKNNSGYEIKNIRVSEILDTDLVRFLNNPPDYENSIWTIDALQAGETIALTLHVEAVAESPEYENTVRIWTVGEDGRDMEIPPGPEDIRSAVVEIRPVPELTIRKEADRETVAAEDVITYTITVSNPGQISEAADVSITDLLPDGTEWLEASFSKDGGKDPAEQEDAPAGSGTVIKDQEPEGGVYRIGDLKAGETVTLTIKARVTEAISVITNRASARRRGGSEVNASVSTEVRKSPPKDPDPDPPEDDPEDPIPDPPEDSPEDPIPDPPEANPEAPEPDPPGEEPGGPASDPPGEEPGVPAPDPQEGNTETPGPSEAIPSLVSYEMPEVPDRKREEVSNNSPETGLMTDHPVRSQVQQKERPALSRQVPDSEVPLAVHGHLCCILHFVIMLLALLTEICYVKSMKKHQSRIFEIRRKLAQMQEL